MRPTLLHGRRFVTTGLSADTNSLMGFDISIHIGNYHLQLPNPFSSLFSPSPYETTGQVSEFKHCKVFVCSLGFGLNQIVSIADFEKQNSCFNLAILMSVEG